MTGRARWNESTRLHARRGDEAARLRETGRELFARYGLRKTTIADLTDPAGIAPSTFYAFYDSKEALYLELLEEEGEELAERFVAESFEAHDDPADAIEAFLLAVMEEIETNPLVHQVVVGDDLDLLRAQYTEAELAEGREADVAYFLPYVEAWYERGVLHGPSPRVVAHAIRAVTFLALHEEDLPEYRAVKETVVAAVARGLVSGTDDDQ